MKFKHTLKNYLLFPFILTINPVVYSLSFVVNNAGKHLEYIADILPKFDVDYSKENLDTRKKVLKEYFKLTQRTKKESKQ